MKKLEHIPNGTELKNSDKEITKKMKNHFEEKLFEILGDENQEY